MHTLLLELYQSYSKYIALAEILPHKNETHSVSVESFGALPVLVSRPQGGGQERPDGAEDAALHQRLRQGWRGWCRRERGGGERRREWRRPGAQEQQAEEGLQQGPRGLAGHPPQRSEHGPGA